MVKVINKVTGLEFDLEDNAAAELIRCNPLTFEIVKASKEALKMIDKAELPTDEQKLLGEVQEVDLEEKYKDVEIIEPTNEEISEVEEEKIEMVEKAPKTRRKRKVTNG